jgi:hypothetical protein
MLQVITVVGGVITNIAAPAAEETTQQEPTPATDNQLAELSRILQELTHKFTRFETATKADIEALKAAPVTNSVNVPFQKKQNQDKTYKSRFLDK